MENQTTFNAKFISSLAVREYRVYVRRHDLFFIEVPGLSTTADVLTTHFGLIGMLIRQSLKKKAKLKAAALFQSAEYQDPEQVIGQNKNNFKIYVPEIRDAALEPPALFALHGGQAGRWNVTLRDDKKLRFEFETTDDLQSALNVLPTLLNGTLRVNVEWNAAKKRFQKPRQPH